MTTSILKQFENAVLKHLQGQHNQKRHGYRYGSIDAARRSMRGTTDPKERAEYRKRAGMPTPVKRAKVEEKPKELSREEKVAKMFDVSEQEIARKFSELNSTRQRNAIVMLENYWEKKGVYYPHVSLYDNITKDFLAKYKRMGEKTFPLSEKQIGVIARHIRTSLDIAKANGG